MRGLAGIQLLACVVALSAGVALAASRRIERDRTAVMSGPGSFYARAGELALGSEVEVVAEKGAWIEIRAGKVHGFVPRSALEARKEGGLAALGSAVGSSKPSVSSQTAGVKGFNEDVERAHAKERGVDFAGVERMEQQQVKPEDIEAFVNKRGLGAGEVAR